MMGVRQRTQTRADLVLGVSLTLVALAALTVSTKAAAQVPSPAVQEAKSPVPPSWFGLWKANMTGRNDPPGYKTQIPYSAPSSVYDQLLQPWALEKKQKTNQDDDPGGICRLEGALRTIRDVDFVLLAAPGKIVIASHHTEEGGYRQIYLDSPHPPSLTPSRNGDSRAHWEGETLVVDTIGLTDKSWISAGLHPHTDALHMAERMRLLMGGQYLEVVGTLDDPKAFKEPIVYSRYYKKDNANGMDESVCNEDTDSHWWRHYKAVRSAERRTESKP